MFDYKFNTGTTNTTISVNLFGIYDPKHLCYKKNDYVSLLMRFMHDSRISQFNHLRTVMFYDVLLEESEMLLIFRNFLLINA